MNFFKIIGIFNLCYLLTSINKLFNWSNGW